MCNNDCNCIAEILSVICILQEKAERKEECLDTCDKAFLGDPVNCVCCNTRPVMLYTGFSNGTPWEMPTSKTDTNCGTTGINSTDDCSSVFRVEKLDGCCCTFRVLAKERCAESVDSRKVRYVATDSFFTIDLKCVCAIRCLKDTFVEGV